MSARECHLRRKHKKSNFTFYALYQKMECEKEPVTKNPDWVTRAARRKRFRVARAQLLAYW